MAEYFLVRRDGSRDGPYSEEDLLDLLDADELSAGALCEDAATGRRLRVSDLFKAIPPENGAENPVPPPPPPPAVSPDRRPPSPKASARDAGTPLEFSPWRPAAATPEMENLSLPPRRAGAGRVRFQGHPSPLVYWRSLLLAALLAAAGGFAGQIDRQWEKSGLAAGLGGALLTLGLTHLRRLSRRYIITTRHVERQDGLLSVSSREVRLEDIRTINVVKTGARGLPGVGTVTFSTTAAGDGDDVTFHDVSRAHALKELVRDLQNRLE